jgi:hypothetical protein
VAAETGRLLAAPRLSTAADAHQQRPSEQEKSVMTFSTRALARGGAAAVLALGIAGGAAEALAGPAAASAPAAPPGCASGDVHLRVTKDPSHAAGHHADIIHYTAANSRVDCIMGGAPAAPVFFNALGQVVAVQTTEQGPYAAPVTISARQSAQSLAIIRNGSHGPQVDSLVFTLPASNGSDRVVTDFPNNVTGPVQFGLITQTHTSSAPPPCTTNTIAFRVIDEGPGAQAGTAEARISIKSAHGAVCTLSHASPIVGFEDIGPRHALLGISETLDSDRTDHLTTTLSPGQSFFIPLTFTQPDPTMRTIAAVQVHLDEMPAVTLPWPHGPNGYDHVYVGNVDPVPGS